MERELREDAEEEAAADEREREVLLASAAEGIAPPPVARRTRTSEGKETPTSGDAPRDRAPLRADLPERALLEGGDVLESSLLGTNAHNN